MSLVFGPVPSRRLGQSLGIDTIPPKTCNWNCIYCQLGRTVPLRNERREYYPREDILTEVDKALAVHDPIEIDAAGYGQTSVTNVYLGTYEIDLGWPFGVQTVQIEGIHVVGWVEVTPWVWGDLDGDGDVDQADLGTLLADWGCIGNCAGDCDRDGDTDQADLGILLSAHYEGSAVEMIRSAGGSAERLARTLTEMPLFRDVHEYDGLTVPIYKRAQITPADLSLALADHELGRFSDLHQLTIFADNLVPHVLRVDGVLEYEDSLARRIDHQRPIEAGSPEEIEIRAVAIHAVELVVSALRGLGREVRAMDVDYLLWNRGQQPAYKARPRHRARSVYY